ncbi:MAG TPA: c-type cytochrome [Rhizomicrobium sp.]|nr:c-type cytochrome [Rhizomicrobium sp.]
MRKSAVTLAALTCLIGAGVAFAEDAAKPPSVSAETTATTVCQNCHGASGNSVSATFPRLNGQQADYIVAQLKNFRDHSRSDPHARAYMWGMASQLDDASIDALAHYYASQKPTPPQSGGELAATGAKIYANGVEAQNVPACQTCHGDHGEGASVIPRIAGQHADYLRRQLEAFRQELRESDVMHANTKDMTDSQIDALISYLGND